MPAKYIIVSNPSHWSRSMILQSLPLLPLPAHFYSVFTALQIPLYQRDFFLSYHCHYFSVTKAKTFFPFSFKLSELWQNFNILFSFHLFFAPRSLQSIRQAPADQGSSLPQTDWSAKVKSSIRILLHKDIIPLSFPGCIK